MRVGRTHRALLLCMIAQLFLIEAVWGEPGGQASYTCGRFQLVSGQYDVRMTSSDTGKVEYETHRTMFLIDTKTGKTWLFLVENNMFDGRWGWIPAKGFVEKETQEKGK